jgi:hypothetical protein
VRFNDHLTSWGERQAEVAWIFGGSLYELEASVYGINCVGVCLTQSLFPLANMKGKDGEQSGRRG